jgi:predicted Holliday junction resolvase-like endonuclease
VKKCRELNSEIVNNQAKIKTALRLSQEDQQTINQLQKEMEKTWKLVSMSQEKENRAKVRVGVGVRLCGERVKSCLARV